MATVTARRSAPARSSRTRSRSAVRSRRPDRVRANGGAVVLPRTGIASIGRRALSIPDSRLIGMLSRGRIWIVVFAILLFGLVYLSVYLLRINASISRMSQQSQSLVESNARMRTQVADLSAPERIMQAAASQGMVTVQPGTVRYLSRYPEPTDTQRNLAFKVIRSFGQ